MYEHDIALAVQDPKFLARFWSNVEKADGCWLWKRRIGKDGYGRTTLQGVGKRKRGDMRTHRIAWTIANGPIPDGRWILHHCDVRACNRPDHLFVGDATSNVYDMIAKGRSRSLPAVYGEATSQHKLTAPAVLAIRRRAQTETQASLAISYGVSRSAIHNIVHRYNWAHVKDDHD